MSAPLPDDFRDALGLKGQPTMDEGLAVAEDRLREVLSELNQSPPGDQKHAELKRQKESLEPLIEDLREVLHGTKVDELCDSAESALAERPTKKAKAREFLRQARREGRPLAANGPYMRRLQALETRIEDGNVSVATPPSRGSKRTEDLGLGATMAPKNQAPYLSRDDALATGTPLRTPRSNTEPPQTPGSGPTGVFTPTPTSRADTGTGGETSSIPAGLATGMKVGLGRFTLIRELGRGGMGVVWLAADRDLRREVALKLLPPEVAADDMSLEDLRRETCDSQRLAHPNILRIHDFFDGRGYESRGERAFISMEFVDGPTLRSLLTRQSQRCFSWEDLHPLADQLCDALGYAHEERIIHRDLKPSNLMLDTKNKRLKLADFGIAATMSDSMSRVSKTGEATIAGTLPYMGPQQMRGQRPATSDDIYSLGATLYELLTSKPPFFRGDIQHQVRNEPAQDLTERLKELGVRNVVPPHVNAAILSCLEKDAEKRPKTSAAVKQLLADPVEAKVKRAGPQKSPKPEPKGDQKKSDDGQPTGPSPKKPESSPTGSSSGKRKLILVGAAVLVLALVVFGVTAVFHKPKQISFDNHPATNTPVPIHPTDTLTNDHQDHHDHPPITPVVPTPAFSEVMVTVAPPEAELLSNNIPIPASSLRLTGKPGESFELKGRLTGYAPYIKTITFPAIGQRSDESVVLVPKPAILTVDCATPVQSILFSNAQKSFQSDNYAKGVELAPGQNWTMVINTADYDTYLTNISPMTPGGSKTISVGPLSLKTAVLELEFDPDTALTVWRPGIKPTGIMPPSASYRFAKMLPRTQYTIIASKSGYKPLTNTFNLEPGSSNYYHFASFEALSASLAVTASPKPFKLAASWNGGSRESDDGRLVDLPANTTLLVTVSAPGYVSVSTNVTLSPGQPESLAFGTLPSANGYMLLSYLPEDATVTYQVDNHAPVQMDNVTRLDGLPLGRVIYVTVHKTGYVDLHDSLRLRQAGDKMNLGTMQPRRVSLTLTGPSENENADVYVDGASTSAKGGGRISDLVYGRTYLISLRKSGYVSATNNYTVNSEEPNPLYFPALVQQEVPKPSVTDGAIKSINDDIDKAIRTVTYQAVWTSSTRSNWRDWANQIERENRRNNEVWPGIRDRLQRLRNTIENKAITGGALNTPPP